MQGTWGQPSEWVLYRRGSSGFVLLALDRQTGQQVAIKFIPTGAAFKEASIQRELTNQAMCSGHPHIVQLLVRPLLHSPSPPNHAFYSHLRALNREAFVPVTTSAFSSQNASHNTINTFQKFVRMGWVELLGAA